MWMTTVRARRTVAAATLVLFGVTFAFGFLWADFVSENGAQAAATPEFDVNSTVRQGKVYLEFRLHHFRLVSPAAQAPKRYGEGHIVLYVDGRTAAKLDRRAYVLRALSPGVHTLRAELVHNDGTPYGIDREWTVTLP